MMILIPCKSFVQRLFCLPPVGDSVDWRGKWNIWFWDSDCNNPGFLKGRVTGDVSFMLDQLCLPYRKYEKVSTKASGRRFPCDLRPDAFLNSSWRTIPKVKYVSYCMSAQALSKEV